MRGYKHTSRVYEPIYTVKNLYDDFIILQYFFSPCELCAFYVFKWNLVLFTIYSKVVRLEPRY